ncbi:SAM-dependent methyltransferase, MidA family [Roseivivax lentus]|uniref:SAM-dependent methyltransferase, MidA family n=1 Tax=Roseivivax lentus TaxID=633194 RepID=A0A1N7L038_9RHOB|nr:SAM-dependent methyltransferase [Roseivivax lentus]SIS67126.1 SAM-dependent methyltransferase, MidA family [Roseivivax lentus]
MSLTDLLRMRIAAEGPMSIAEYMTHCLHHPRFGYYATRDPLGAGGDFTTAPEISQMFGELLGLALAQSWQDQGAPAHFVLAELGPGRGTLMADLLRATAAVPGFHDAAHVTLVEASPTLRLRQRETLRAHPADWVNAIGDLPEAPLFFVANEFFDALPVRQFLRNGPGWRERVIGLDGDDLTFGLGERAARPDLAHRMDDTEEGDLVEIGHAAQGAMAELGHRIEARGGAGLVVDYGDGPSLGDTFQAVHGHEKVSPLDTPGAADLTAHVDFAALAGAARPARASTPVPQGVFLERLGITARAQALARRLSGPALESHIAAHRRLTHPDEMGSLFKVMGIVHSAAKLPPGLDT